MKGTDNQTQDTSRDLLDDLFRDVSPRERPSREDESMVRQALHAEWSQMNRRRRIRRAMIALASAASLVLAAFIGLNLAQKSGIHELPPQLANVEKLIGTAQIRSGVDEATSTLQASSLLSAGRFIATGTGARLALRWRNGESIRLDEHTEIQLKSDGEINLLTGRVYVDTTGVSPATDLLITTPAGRVRHLGTRYLTEVSDAGTTVSVREGQVQWKSLDRVETAGRGEQLSVRAGGAFRREVIPTYGPRWQWTESVAPVFSSDGRSLAEFLAWVAHESGRDLEYGSPQAQALAGRTLLRGKVEMAPMKALNVMMQTSDLESEVSAGTIVIHFR